MILWHCWNSLLASRCKKQVSATRALGKSQKGMSPSPSAREHPALCRPQNFDFTNEHLLEYETQNPPGKLELCWEGQLPESYHFQPLFPKKLNILYVAIKSTCDDRTMGYDPEKVGNIIEYSASLTGNFYF